MAKKKISRKHNTPIYIYDLGGKIASVGNAASSIIGTGISNARIADTSDIENQIDNAKSYIVGANDNESLMNEWGTWTPMDRINWRDIRGLDAGQGISNTLGTAVSGASAGATVGGPIGAIAGGAAGLISGITSALVGDAKAKRKAEELNKQIKIANTRGLLSLEEKARNIDAQNDLLALANYTANGGRIYIKPQNRDKFTKYCGGKVTSECIAKGKRSSDPAVRKRATFADNASKWKYDGGGELNMIDEINNSQLGTLVKFLDPTGISSWYDVYSAGKDFYEDPSWGNAGSLFIETLGAAPLVGKAGKGLREALKLGTKYFAKKEMTEKYGLEVADQLVRDIVDQATLRGPGLVKDVYDEAQYIREKVAKEEKNKKKDFPENTFDKGGLMHQHGGIFSNDVVTIDNGGTHEQNPFDGVQIGVDNQGIPNLVEEGEVIWNDYVFSNRLKPTQEFKDKYKVKGETFADIAKEMQKESEERPNDPISKSGLEDSMIKLQIEQENIRMKDNRKEYKNIFERGGWQNKEMDAPSLIDTIEAITPGLPDIKKIAKVKAAFPESSDTNQNNHFARYAPIAGSALGVLENLFSKPDYSNANLILEAANQAGNYTPVGYTPIGNYLSYNPLDINYYINKLAGQSSATRRAIINQSAGNRATATAGLLAADYNTQEKYGDLIRQAEEFNLAQRQAVEQFNRATNQANAEMGLQASRANQVARQAANEAILKGVAQAVALKEEQDKQRAASRSVNLTNLFDNIGALGKEEYIMDMIRKNPYLLYDWLDNYKGSENSCGGQLTIKKKKRRK